jgi:phage shock protein C
MDMDKKDTRQLRRTRDGRVLTGVCSGVGRYFDVDANLVRLGLVAFSIFGGAGIALYVVAWLIIPAEGATASRAEDLIRKGNESPAVQDALRRTRETFTKTPA